MQQLQGFTVYTGSSLLPVIVRWGATAACTQQEQDFDGNYRYQFIASTSRLWSHKIVARHVTGMTQVLQSA